MPAESQLRDAALRAAWAEVISAGAVGSCHPQRVEFRRSARTIDEYEQMSAMFAGSPGARSTGSTAEASTCSSVSGPTRCSYISA